MRLIHGSVGSMSATLCPPRAFLPTVPAMTDTALTVQQTARPTGFPTADHFRFAESPVPEPAPGTALVENLYWSVDPYHREMMDGEFDLNAPLEGRALGRIVASRTSQL